MRLNIRSAPSHNKRQRARELERQRKEVEKRDRVEERNRLRKLRMNQAEEKLQAIKQASGMKEAGLDIEKWAAFLSEDWNDKDWQARFEDNFGDDYYADRDEGNGDVAIDNGRKHEKLRKPRFEEDIDIVDLVPDFDEAPQITLTDDDNSDVPDVSDPVTRKARDRKAGKAEIKRKARKERRHLEAVVDSQVNLDLAIGKVGAPRTDGLASFRYRETSPNSFGLGPHEILMASDSQLNQFVGIKKLASFRDEHKKRKDRKHLGKKARLRKWRQETFGNESGPTKTFQDFAQEQI